MRRLEAVVAVAVLIAACVPQDDELAGVDVGGRADGQDAALVEAGADASSAPDRTGSDAAGDAAAADAQAPDAAGSVDQGRPDQAPLDGDGDGTPDADDCAPEDASRHPGAAEVCNQADDDCDGLADEGVGNACGGCGAVPDETCDGRDEDCDGQTDEGLLNACGRCGPVPDEVCDGADNDCDGAADEGFVGLGSRCALGAGECRRFGVYGCGAGQVRCIAEPGPPADEVCDGLDNDCDGATDEGVGNGCGGCGPVPAEVCNGEDEDCDGQTDEGVGNRCGGCGPVPAEVCNGEDDDCDGQTDEGVGNRCGGCGPVPAEVCNGEDDDCDGQSDEGLALVACQSECGVGEQRCVDGAPGPCEPRQPPPEACNGQDDDCDGATDEGVGNRCGGCGPVPVEVCNADDDDCDGAADEGLDCPRRCGDGRLDRGEDCDDGANVAGDGCSPACRLEPRCASLCDPDGTQRRARSRWTMRSPVGELDWSFGSGLVLDDDTAVVLNGNGVARVYSPLGDGREAPRRTLDGLGPAFALRGDVLAGAGDGVVQILIRGQDGAWADGQVLPVPADAQALALTAHRLLVGAQGLAIMYEAQAQGVFGQGTRLDAPDAGAGFGSAVAVWGQVAVVGAPPAGVHVFIRMADGRWSPSARLVDPEPGGRSFGDQLAMVEDHLAVSATRARGDRVVHLFERRAGTWRHTQTVPGGLFRMAGQRMAILSDPTVTVYRLTADARWVAEHQIELRLPHWVGVWGFPDVRRPGIALSGDRLFVGTTFEPAPPDPGDVDPRLSSGEVVLYELGGAECLDGVCVCRPGAAGPTCHERPECGDGVVQGAEQCDPGVADGEPSCTARCTRCAACGCQLNACGLCPVAIDACNGVDDDCDGLVDEGQRNACGGCGPAAVELCDGVDQDCDGVVDEGSAVRCSAGRGACLAEGVRACVGGQLGACDAVPAAPQPEACNGVDDDCDGRTDERVPPDAPRPAEVLNGIDDDCDGQADEDLGCVPDFFPCNDGRCIPRCLLGDGQPDCAGAEDESCEGCGRDRGCEDQCFDSVECEQPFFGCLPEWYGGIQVFACRCPAEFYDPELDLCDPF